MTRDFFVKACLRYLNVPYIYGGDNSLRGFDCSGLIIEFYKMLGLAPKSDMTAQNLFFHFYPNSDDKGMEVGSLFFFGKDINHITHVEMMIDHDTLIGAKGGGPTVKTFDDAVKAGAYVKLSHFKSRKDLVSILTPKGLPWFHLKA